MACKKILKIAPFNVNGINSRLPRLLKWVAKPDIVDHLLLNPVLAMRLRQAGVDRWVRAEEKPSEHVPTWIQVDAG
jgi:exonuclease III